MDNDNGGEGENSNGSITFMIDVKIDLRGGPGAKKEEEKKKSDR